MTEENLTITDNQQEQILKELDLDKVEETKTESSDLMKKKKSSVLLVVLSLVAISAGVATGFGAYKLQNQSSKVSTGPQGSDLQQVAGSSVKAGDIFGIKDDSVATDEAEGYLEEADAADEGSHLLIRPGGDTQTVHLTSSATDLDKFVGMEVRVAGETFKGQQAGWLMDVLQVEVVAVDGEKPEEF